MQEEGKQQTTDRVIVQRSNVDRLTRQGKGRPESPANAGLHSAAQKDGIAHSNKISPVMSFDSCCSQQPQQNARETNGTIGMSLRLIH